MDTRSADELDGPHITGEQEHCLLDDAPRVTITDCCPGELVTLQATFDLDGARHRAEAIFHADASGRVDLARDPSVGGSYAGIDPWGLWWSADPIGPAGDQAPATPVRTIVTATVESRSNTCELVRHWLSPGATLEVVRDEGVWGLFARPAGEGPFPGMVAFGGSGGGLGAAASWAPLLASHGFATLAIAYFGVPGLPPSLVGIDVEVVERACQWLLRRDDVSQSGVGVMGASRGSELALLAGVLLPEVRAVVGFAPSGIAWGGLDEGGPVAAPAWTFRGEVIPYIPIGNEALVSSTRAAPAGPVALRTAFERSLTCLDITDRAVIPVERSHGPILLVSGDADAMWPSVEMARVAERRAREHGFVQLSHLVYEDAGHVCAGIPGVPVITEVHHPVTGGHYSFGGSRAANARARSDSWPRVLTFLRTALATRT
jgi:dienelactone hydrolase